MADKDTYVSERQRTTMHDDDDARLRAATSDEPLRIFIIGRAWDDRWTTRLFTHTIAKKGV